MLTPDPSIPPIAVVVQDATGPMAQVIVAVAVVLFATAIVLAFAAYVVAASTAGRA